MGGGRPLTLLILDGWGLDLPGEFNAVESAPTPNLDLLFRDYPHTRLDASGAAVGLPEGQMGNSEVGHLNIGAGRIVYQDLTRISLAVRNGELAANPVISRLLSDLGKSGGKLHLMGLLSDGGVHSHLDHLFALLRLAQEQGIQELRIHAFMDGRDTPPASGGGFLAQLEKFLTELGRGQIATVMGRFYAMDRDKRWERVEKAYRALTAGEGSAVPSALAGIEQAYAAGQTDEFIEPLIVAGGDGCVADGDGILFFNFRADRARELTRAFTDSAFDGFVRRKMPRLAGYVCLTEYDETFGLPVAFPPQSLANILGEVLSHAGLKQLRAAETEKYAHVTFFFNGGSEPPFPGEERLLIPSPKEVATYDLKPAMSAFELTEELVRRVRSGAYDVIIVNYANLDMVGHTGIFPAALEAVETVDACVGKVVAAVLEAGGNLLVTSDHGNCEKMRDEKGEPHTAHTSNPVPLILVDPKRRNWRLRPGILADIAPTLIELLGLEKPAEMSGKSLLSP
ncbi:MAG: 2,3-bisphosphoglycerate-independent phosphoglycerate mutase [Deltaproteobacteria bacterium]|nr:2,3-bisphosphoglycerate-independent phosphoglycerate mutase [Deltaproteobacteria bacterium]